MPEPARSTDETRDERRLRPCPRQQPLELPRPCRRCSSTRRSCSSWSKGSTNGTITGTEIAARPGRGRPGPEADEAGPHDARGPRHRDRRRRAARQHDEEDPNRDQGRHCGHRTQQRRPRRRSPRHGRRRPRRPSRRPKTAAPRRPPPPQEGATNAGVAKAAAKPAAKKAAAKKTAAKQGRDAADGAPTPATSRRATPSPTEAPVGELEDVVVEPVDVDEDAEDGDVPARRRQGRGDRGVRLRHPRRRRGRRPGPAGRHRRRHGRPGQGLPQADRQGRPAQRRAGGRARQAHRGRPVRRGEAQLRRQDRHEAQARAAGGSPRTARRPRTTCSRPTCASSSRWPSATPVAACSSSTSSRRATSA